jgi:hypothetical protein
MLLWHSDSFPDNVDDGAELGVVGIAVGGYVEQWTTWESLWRLEASHTIAELSIEDNVEPIGSLKASGRSRAPRGLA